jgi:uncharacterized membrane protein YedE/YeeE
MELWLLFVALAATIGFVVDRAGICTVKAVEELLSTRRAFLLLSFVKTVMWVLGTSIVIVSWLGAQGAVRPGYQITVPSLLGGFIFGVGAVLNGGCAFSTLTRLGNGNLGMLISLAGVVFGVALFELANGLTGWAEYRFATPWFMPSGPVATALSLALALWIFWESVRLWRTAPKGSWRSRLVARRYRLSTAAAVMGLSNGILYALLGTWSYTNTLRLPVTHLFASTSTAIAPASEMLLWWLFLALLIGVVVSAFTGRSPELRWRPRSRWFAYLFGGVLMGLGVALVPGGNDVLLLNTIPGFSPHAIPAFFMMLLGIAATLAVIRKRGGHWPVVDCRNDLCRENR